MAVWLSFVLLAALNIGAAVSLIRYDRESALQRTESELQSLARVLEEHVARSFGETENAVAEIATLLAARNGTDALGERDLRALLSQRADRKSVV